MNTKYLLLFNGDCDFFETIISVSKEFHEPYFEPNLDVAIWTKSPEYFQGVPALYYNKEPTNAFTGLEIIGGISMFIGSCFAKKIFDEVYERTAKRSIAAFLDKFFAKSEYSDDAKLEYRDVIYFEDIKLVVVIRVLVERNTTMAVEKLLLQTHRIAHTFIEQEGKKAPIHCHVIENGQVNIEPELFDNLEHIEKKDKAKFMELIKTRKITIQDGKLKRL